MKTVSQCILEIETDLFAIRAAIYDRGVNYNAEFLHAELTRIGQDVDGLLSNPGVWLVEKENKS